MDRFFNLDNGIFRGLNKLVDCICLSLLFIVSCIPIFTIGAAYTALYYTVHKVIRNDRGYVWKTYAGAFKSNFKQATFMWLVMLFFGLVLYVDTRILISMANAGQAIGKVYVLFPLLIVFEILWALYIFPYTARFENTKKYIMKNAGLMAILHLPKTFLSLILAVATGLVVFIVPLSLVIVPTLFAWIESMIMESVFRKYMTEEDKIAEDEMNREYKN
ncbi:YesL family protein [Lachnospiraceae bacterium ZAX-1]